MKFLLAPIDQTKDAKELLETLISMDVENAAKEEIAVSLIAGYLNQERLGTGWIFRPLVGAAAAIVAKSPKHSEDCKCDTCTLRSCLGMALEQSAPVVEARAKALRDWELWTQPHCQVTQGRGSNPFLTKAKEVAIPGEVKRIAAEHAEEIADGGGY